MEAAEIISPPRADCLRAFVYDDSWQMRLAELYYKKAYEALADNPARDWALYGDAGYRYAYLTNQRGDVGGSLAIVTAILAKAEGNSDFPTVKKTSLLGLMANCQVELNQQDEAKQTYLKAYEMMEKTYGGKGPYPFNMLVMCYNTFHFFLRDVL
jgi:tetratricopeptide (TPR) repeat protein